MCQIDLLFFLENVLVMKRFCIPGLKSSTVTEASSFTLCITNELRLSARPNTCVCVRAQQQQQADIRQRQGGAEQAKDTQLGVRNSTHV